MGGGSWWRGLWWRGLRWAGLQGGRGAPGWGSEAPREEPTASLRLSRLESRRLALGGRGVLGLEVFLGLHGREGSVEQWLTARSRVSTFSQPLGAMLPVT